MPVEGRWSRLGTRAAGGMRLWAGDLLLIDAWEQYAVEHTQLVPALADALPLRIEYRDSDLPASLDLVWTAEEAAGRVYLPALP